MPKQSISDIDVAGKLVLVRADLNVPLDGATISDDTRIRASLPTIQHLASSGAKGIFICSHLGRPKNGPEAKFSLAPCAARLSELLEKPVKLVTDCVGDEVKSAVDSISADQVRMLERAPT
jgi:phosphoglycerate kinase